MTRASEALSDPNPSAPSLPVHLPRGFVLGDYTIDGWLRDGGMAAIYRAHRTEDDTKVALKLQFLSTATSPEICARFDREAEAMRRIEGATHVVELHANGVLGDGRRYLVMEWLEGEDLEEAHDDLRNADQRFSVAEACRIGRAIALGLHTIHEHKLVHRDIKPANVMIGTGADGRKHVKLIDFGIVADLRDASDGDGFEAVMGTSAYMAPEQVAGEAPCPATDLFALGVVLYELLTGTCVPPDGWTPESLPRVDSHRPGVPSIVTRIVHGCMSRDPEERPGPAREVARLLGRVLQSSEVVEAAAAGGEERASVRPRVPSAALPVAVPAPHATTETPGASVQPTRPRAVEETPVRTGKTTLTPRSMLLARNTAVRTGRTQVSMEPVRAPERPGAGPRYEVPVVGSTTELSGAHPLPRAPSPAAVTLDRGSGGSPHGIESEHELSDDWDFGRKKRWWTIGLAIVPVLALGAWLGLARTAPPVDEPEPLQIIIAEVPSAESVDGGSTREDGTPDDSSAAVPGGSRRADAEGEKREAPASLEASKRRRTREAGRSPRTRGSEHRGLGKAACQRVRFDATTAKINRDWPAVLEATAQPVCWSESTYRLTRKRLRVEAFAEMGNFARCMEEAGNSRHPKIVARSRLCRKKVAEAR